MDIKMHISLSGGRVCEIYCLALTVRFPVLVVECCSYVQSLNGRKSHQTISDPAFRPDIDPIPDPEYKIFAMSINHSQIYLIIRFKKLKNDCLAFSLISRLKLFPETAKLLYRKKFLKEATSRQQTKVISNLKSIRIEE